MSVCLLVCLFVHHTFSLRLTVFLPPLPKVQCPKNLDFWNPWGKVKERSGLRFENFSHKGCKKVLRCLSPTRSKHTYLLKNPFELIFYASLSKTYMFNFFMAKPLRKTFLGLNLDFCAHYFLFLPWNWFFRTNMESSAAVTLHFEGLAVQNYLFLKDVWICWWNISNCFTRYFLCLWLKKNIFGRLREDIQKKSVFLSDIVQKHPPVHPESKSFEVVLFSLSLTFFWKLKGGGVFMFQKFWGTFCLNNGNIFEF